MDEVTRERWQDRAHALFLRLANARSHEEQNDHVIEALQDAHDQGIRDE